jgi:hypothetical protein
MKKIVLLFRMFQNLWRPRGLFALAVRVPMPAFTGRASGLPLVARALPFTQGTARTGLPLPSRAGRVGQTWSFWGNSQQPVTRTPNFRVIEGFLPFFQFGQAILF